MDSSSQFNEFNLLGTYDITGQKDLLDTFEFEFVDLVTTYKCEGLKVEKYIVDHLKKGKADQIFFVPHKPG